MAVLTYVARVESVVITITNTHNRMHAHEMDNGRNYGYVSTKNRLFSALNLHFLGPSEP